ncbi:hypothetical protein HHL11_04460 [Ramlibacter sp. G-1-2-2]|uniref:DUF983 domain-containing protein n=1 Tax=Ramlibacter agri TaxID=2728837 RepID=A0A848H044_9BURK|nr:hypothetical protein [Ramlibacter agri]NML42992.1 hypothetical protein [Ramlibacter agri]
MNYRCPQCSKMLKVPSLFFHDITACPKCGQKVVLGDFFAFFVAAITMIVLALSVLYILSQELDEYYVAAGYALAAGVVAGIIVLVLLGRATPFKRVKGRRSARHAQPAPKA